MYKNALLLFTVFMNELTTEMGTRRKSSRPIRDRYADLPRPRRWLHQPRRGRHVKISRLDRDETFVGLET